MKRAPASKRNPCRLPGEFHEDLRLVEDRRVDDFRRTGAAARVRTRRRAASSRGRWQSRGPRRARCPPAPQPRHCAGRAASRARGRRGRVHAQMDGAGHRAGAGLRGPTALALLHQPGNWKLMYPPKTMPGWLPRRVQSAFVAVRAPGCRRARTYCVRSPASNERRGPRSCGSRSYSPGCTSAPLSGMPAEPFHASALPYQAPTACLPIVIGEDVPVVAGAKTSCC